MRRLALITLLSLLPLQSACAEITRIWLTHRTTDPSKIVVNWETTEPGNSIVRYGLNRELTHRVAIDETVTLHHVEIPIPKRDKTYPLQREQLCPADVYEKPVENDGRDQEPGRSGA